MAQPNINTMKAEIKRLEGKAKAGWKSYFVVSDDLWSLSNILCKSRAENQKLLGQLKNGEEVNLDHLKRQFIELYEQANKNCECPVCFELMNKEIVNVATCGHLTCKECYAKMKECPICRKAYWKPTAGGGGV